MGWDRTNTTSHAGHVGHSSSQWLHAQCYIYLSHVPSSKLALSQIFQVPRRRKKLCVLQVYRYQPKQDLGSSSLSLLPNGTIPTCPSAKLLSTGPLGLIQDLQQLLYPFRCCSFNCSYKPGLPDLSLFCRPIFVYKDIYAATQFQLPVGPFITQPL